jgi:hypothetical protein
MPEDFCSYLFVMMYTQILNQIACLGLITNTTNRKMAAEATAFA